MNGRSLGGKKGPLHDTILWDNRSNQVILPLEPGAVQDPSGRASDQLPGPTRRSGLSSGRAFRDGLACVAYQ